MNDGLNGPGHNSASPSSSSSTRSCRPLGLAAEAAALPKLSFACRSCEELAAAESSGEADVVASESVLRCSDRTQREFGVSLRVISIHVQARTCHLEQP